MCGECSNAGEAGETWARVHEHVLLTSERVLLDLLERFDEHLQDQARRAPAFPACKCCPSRQTHSSRPAGLLQGVELQRSASAPLQAPQGLPEAQQLRRMASERAAAAAAPTHQPQAPVPRTLRELLLSLAKVGPTPNARLH